MKKLCLLSMLPVLQLFAAYSLEREESDQAFIGIKSEWKVSFSPAGNFYLLSGFEGNQRPFRYILNDSSLYSVV